MRSCKTFVINATTVMGVEGSYYAMCSTCRDYHNVKDDEGLRHRGHLPHILGGPLRSKDEAQRIATAHAS